MMKDELNALLQKDLTRKDFLKHVAIGFAAITGVAAVLKTMNGFSGGSIGKSLGGRASNGYGSSVYGGRRNQHVS